ncbi:MAG: secretin and TonB N-terminal domain-containing protein [Acidobacteriota bacterium]|nr:secretin and TonB N-terminal domain-containing protein [Acidobacteriota bacterium]
MRRGYLRGHTSWFLALTIAIAFAAPAVMGMSGDAYDDRPPLLASEPVPEGLAPAARLSEVTVSEPTSGGMYEVWLEADGALAYQVFTLTGPDRIVFDLPGVVAPQAGQRLEVGSDTLVRVRVGQYQEDPTPMARVVLDLLEPMEWSVVREGTHLLIRVSPQGGDPLPMTQAQPSEAPGSSGEPEASLASAVAPAPVVPEPPRAEPDPAMYATASDAEPGTPVEMAIAAETVPAPREVRLEAPASPVAEPAAPAPGGGEAMEVPEPATGTVPESPATPSLTEPVAKPAPTSGLPAAPPPATAWQEPEIAQVVEEAAGLATRVEAPRHDTVSLPVETGRAEVVPLPDTEAKTIEDARRVYSGRKVSLQLIDADIKQVFSLFHDISGLNFVLDPAVSGVVTIVVDDVPWDQALDLILKNNGLDMVLEGNVIRIAPISKLAQESAARKALFEAKELEVPPVTITRTLSYAKAKEVQAVVRDGILSRKGRVIVDERTNTLIIRDIPTRVEAIDKLLTTLDAETPQVMIEARIVEVSRDFVKDLGVRWGLFAAADPGNGTQTNLQFPHRAAGAFDLNLARNPAASALGFSFGNVLDSVTLDITLDALETEGYARRLSSPKIATQNNEMAEIEQGVRIPVVSTTATEIDVRFVSASLRLEVTPQITAEGTVVLEIEVETTRRTSSTPLAKCLPSTPNGRRPRS